MSEGISTASLKALLRFPFQGKEWQGRFVVGSLLTLFGFLFVPILPVLGYILLVWRQAIKGEELSLPGWDDWGKLVTDGLRFFAVGLVYTLPAILAYAVGMVAYFTAIFSSGFADAGAGPGGASAGASLMPLAAMAILMLSLLLAMILSLLGAIPLPVATAHFVANDRVGAAFRVREWWPILWKNKLGYFLAWVFAAGLWSVASLVFTLAYYSIALCCLIPVLYAPITFYLALVGAGLFGQTYRESVASLASSAP